MALSIDSKPVFEEKLITLGFTEDQLAKVKAQGVYTLGDAAFLLQLDAADSTDQLNKLAIKIFGEAPLPGDIAKLRRLITMAQTIAAVEFRKNTEEQDGCKMPRAERELRTNQLRRKLGQVITSGFNEPSFSLISSVFQFKDKNVLSHLPLSNCTARRQELAGHKTEERLKMIDGQLKVVTSSVLECELGDPLLARQAMRRRSLAFELVGIGSYETLEKVNEQFFGFLHEPPPTGLHPPTLERLLRADAELWALVGESLSKGLGASAAGVLPVDQAVKEFSKHTRVLHHLQPVQAASIKRPLEADDSASKKPRYINNTTSRRSVPKAKAKAARVPRAPKELLGMPFTGACCYAFNLRGCDKKSCPHAHVCAKCGQKHSLRECPHNK